MKKISGLVVAMALALCLSSCKGSSSAAGVTTPSAGTSGTYATAVSGTVMGGLSPIKNAAIQLFQAGNSSPAGQAVTTNNGTFSIPGSFSSGLYYLMVTNGNAGSGANSQIQLMAIVGAGTSGTSNTTVNELTTAAAGTVLFNFGLLGSSGNVTAPANANGAANALAQYNNLISNGSLNTGNSNLTANQQTSLNSLANALAACVETSGSCSSLYNAATNGSTAATSMMIAMYNSLNSPSATVLTNIYNIAFPLAASTGYTMSSRTKPGGFVFYRGSAPSIQAISAGSSPIGIAIDASGNAWVANSGGNNVTELSSSGTTLGTFSVGSTPSYLAIDASGNIWVTNNGGSTVTELSSSGATLGTFSVGANPFGIAIDASGNVWVANRSSFTVTELSSSGTTLGTFSAGNQPFGIAIDASGNAWVANHIDSTVNKFSSSGTTLGTFSSVGANPVGIAIDASGNAWVANQNAGTKNVVELSPSGTALGTFTEPGFPGPWAIAIDTAGNVWTANFYNANIIELSSAGVVLGTFSSTSHPQGIAFDPSGNVWAGNSSNVTQIQNIAVGPQFFPYSGPIFP